MEYIITRADDTDELYHYGVLGMKWGKRRFQNKDGSLTSKGKTHYSSSTDAITSKPKSEIVRKNTKTNKRLVSEKTFNKLKKGANAALDKADRDNFFNSDSIFSEKSMKTQSRIDRTRDALNSLDYKTLTGTNKGKALKAVGKKFIEDSLDDNETRSFFNDDWDTQMKKQDRNDVIREFLK